MLLLELESDGEGVGLSVGSAVQPAREGGAVGCGQCVALPARDVECARHVVRV